MPRFDYDLQVVKTLGYKL